MIKKHNSSKYIIRSALTKYKGKKMKNYKTKFSITLILIGLICLTGCSGLFENKAESDSNNNSIVNINEETENSFTITGNQSDINEIKNILAADESTINFETNKIADGKYQLAISGNLDSLVKNLETETSNDTESRGWFKKRWFNIKYIYLWNDVEHCHQFKTRTWAQALALWSYYISRGIYKSVDLSEGTCY